jgi:uncharacterized protein involved in exopolysaccharide biosynthesis
MRNDEAPEGEAVDPANLGEDRAQRVSILTWVNSMLRHRSLLVRVPLALAVLVVGWELLQPRDFTSYTSFTPAQMGEGQLSQLGGLAAQFGVRVGGGAGNRSPQFYADLLTSDEVLRLVVESDYSLPAGPLTEEGAAEGSLIEIYGIDEPEPLRAREMAMERLKNSLTVRNDLETSIVNVSVRSRRPRFSQQVAERLLDAVHQFNVERRSSQAASERAFLEERVESARHDLRAAEDSLRRFLEDNRRFEGSPGLQFEHDRRQRRVQMQQQIYTGLQQSLEQAKTEEVRTTPVVTVVQPPTLPALPDPRRLPLKALLALLLGGMIAVAWALGRDAFGRGDWEKTEQVTEFRRLLKETREDLERVAAPMRRLFGRRG